MTATRHRARRGARPADVDPRQLEVDERTAELLALWRAMPYALARDSAGLLTGDRHTSGAAQGSPATVNLTVVEASVQIERGLAELAAQSERLLNLERRRRPPVEAIAALPEWHRSLELRAPALAKHMRQDLGEWVLLAGRAIGVKRHDVRLGPLCPDHRDTKPTPLLRIGDEARVAPTLLDGPPSASTHRVAEDGRLLTASGNPTDWVLTTDGPVWRSVDGTPALTWQTSTTIRCPHCRLTWTDTSQRRILGARLVAAGDSPSVAAAITK
jgi:hypothetical protein